jgi:hypothetical protein
VEWLCAGCGREKNGRNSLLYKQTRCREAYTGDTHGAGVVRQLVSVG